MYAIGVSGFSNRTQVEAVISSVSPDLGRPLKVGVLATIKTLQGVPNRNPKLHPVRENIRRIFYNDAHVLNLVSYTSNERYNLSDQLRSALHWGGPYCDGLQLDLVWPDPKVIRELRVSNDHLHLVLQLNRRAMYQCLDNPAWAAERVCREYGNSINAVIVDATRGGATSTGFNAPQCLRELAFQRDSRRQSFSLILADEVHADNIRDVLVPVKTLVPGVGVEAGCSLVRDDVLDIPEVARFLKTAYVFL